MRAGLSGLKILRPRKNFKILGPNRGQKYTQTSTPRHADARQTCFGPVGLTARPGVVKQREFRRNHTRFRAENFAAAKKFRNFRSESRPKTYANTHAAACRCSPNMLRTCWPRGKAGRRRATWIMAQFHAPPESGSDKSTVATDFYQK